MTAYLDLLRREPDFRRLYLASLAAFGADWFAVVPLLTLLYDVTGSGLWGGLALAVDTLTLALVSPYAGTVVDRLDRRRVIVTAELVGAGFVLLLLLVRGPSTVWVALVAMGGLAAAKAFVQPAAGAALPNLVRPGDDLRRANVLNGASWGTMLAVGAALGGLLTAAFGVTASFVVCAACLVAAAGLVRRTTAPFTSPTDTPRPPARAVDDVREAVGHARRDRRVLALLVCKSGPGLGTGAYVLFPMLAADLGAGELGVGLLLAARGLGAVAGPLVTQTRAGVEQSLFRWAGLCVALFGLGYLGVAASPVLWLTLVLLAVAHFGGGANWVLSSYGLQLVVPDGVRGRVLSLDFALTTLVVATSQVTAGLLSDVLPVRGLLVGYGALVLAYGVGYLVLARRLVLLPAAAGAR